MTDVPVAAAEISVVSARDLIWTTSSPDGDETGSAEHETTVYRSADGRFSTGLWRRDRQQREFVRPYDEVALILEGDPALHLADGRILQAGPGDLIVTPRGSAARWVSDAPVRKLWMIYSADSQ
jgi:uncharacterized cupin superfamily protein